MERWVEEWYLTGVHNHHYQIRRYMAAVSVTLILAFGFLRT
jgi:hypothetical protein